MTATFSFTREPLDTGRGFPAFVPSDGVVSSYGGLSNIEAVPKPLSFYF